MPSFYHRADVDRRSGSRLDGLRQDLDLLEHRLRAGIAEAVGRAVAEAVQDAVLALLAAAPTRPAPNLPHRTSFASEEQGYRPAPLWDDPDHELPGEEEYAPDSWEGPGEAADGPVTRSEPPLWLPALEAALRTALWALSCQPGRRQPLWSAAGISLAAGLAALTGNRLLATSVAVAVAALGPVALAHDVRSGLEVLANTEDE